MRYLFLFILIISCSRNVENNNRIEDDNCKEIENNCISNKVEVPKIKQLYKFEAISGVEIKAIDGTIIRFSPNSFFNYKGVVFLEIIEAYTYFDMIINDLETLDVDGNILESKGMVKIVVKDSLNNELLLSKSMKIKFKDGNIPGFDLYHGVENDKKIHWKLKENKKNKMFAKKYIGYILNEDKSKTHVYDSIEVKNMKEKQFFETLTTGWLNLDKIYSFESNNKIEIQLFSEQFKDFSFYLISKKSNVIFAESEREFDKIFFRQISKNYDFKCVGIQFNNDSAHVVIQNLKEAEDNGFYVKDIKKMSIEELKKIFLNKTS